MSDALESAQQAVDSAQQALDSGAVGANNEFESNAGGLREAVAEVQQAREEAAATRPPPPPASDILSGPGLEQKITLAGDKPVSVRTAARSLNLLHQQQQAEIEKIETELAAQGHSWDELLSGEVPVSRNPGDVAPARDAAPAAPAAQSSAELNATKAELARTQQQAAEAFQQYELARQAMAARDHLSREVRDRHAVIQAKVAALQQHFPGVRLDSSGNYPEADLARLRTQNPQAAAVWDATVAEINSKALEAEALHQRAVDETRRVNAEVGEQQDALFRQKHPEFATDSKQVAELQRQALKTLTDAGFSERELGRAWAGDDGLFLRDARVQSFILNALNLANENQALKERLGLAQDKVKQIRPSRDLPSVQRPGPRPDVSHSANREVAALRKALDKQNTGRAGLMNAIRYKQALYQKTR